MARATKTAKKAGTKTTKTGKKASAKGAAPKRRRGMKRIGKQAQLAFEALAIEGGLLSPDWLARAAQLEAGGQSEADYRIPKGLNLRDEIGRYWRMAQALWGELATGRAASEGSEDRALAVAERFVVGLLRDCFGFGSIAKVEPAEIDGRMYPIGHAALERRVPLVIAPAGRGLDALSERFGDGTRRRSAFGLCQEFLNAEDGAMWGLASDGVILRVVRDNASLTRPAWIEADLGRIFGEERYADFAALWLLVHETRFGRPGQPVTECSLETWREAGREQGTRAREQLRHGVEDALVALGQGFLAHPDNGALRSALAGGGLTKEAYFQELLRLVYRLIFLLTVEERGVLHAEGASEAACKLYAEGYGLRRLRERAVRRSAHDRFHDHWETVKIVFRGLVSGEPRLGLPALAGIFAKDQCPTLDAARLENRFLMLALFRLSWLREDVGLARVNWRDMGPEELGSVYESLLELVPQITEGGRSFGFATGAETKGHARKTTGSYYTPDSLVQVLLDSALEPVVKRTIAEHPEDPAGALLSLSIVDPACGSGHFLLAAARRLAAHAARLQADGTPSAAEYRHALRQVVGRCIYGVDLNPMAVELCKVSLWMEAVEPGLPLTFLDSHIRQGNALLGTTPELMAKGIPDDAWLPIEGDDKAIASTLKKRNKETAGGQRSLETLWASPAVDEAEELRQATLALEAALDGDLAELAQKESQWKRLQALDSYQHQKLVADAWCAAFVWPKLPGELAAAAPINDLWRQLRDRRGQPPRLTAETTANLARHFSFFHWKLEFSHVFANGGFDVVLGNPPWERVKLQEQEFFSSQSDDIARAQNAALRKQLIAQLPQVNPVLWDAWRRATRDAEGQSHFLRLSGRYTLCGRGDINTYAVFSEHNRAMLNGSARAGFIVPTGIATDNTTRDFFVDLVSQMQIAALYGFENEGKLFAGIDHRMNFCLLVLSATRVSTPMFSAFLRNTAQLQVPDRTYTLTPSDIETLNPNTKTYPVFRTRRDASITIAICRRVGVLWNENTSDGNRWQLNLMAMFHMANDSDLFLSGTDAVSSLASRNGAESLPLYEAKMIYHYNHRFGDFALLQEGEREHILPQVPDARLAQADYFTTPRYWVSRNEVDSRLANTWSREWLLGWRDVTDARSSVRTAVACIIPRTAVGDTLLLAMSNMPTTAIAGLYGNLCSFVLDYAARQKIGGTHLKFHVFRQLPVLSPDVHNSSAPWDETVRVGDWLLSRVLELTYTAWDLQPFAQDVGYDGPPFRWDPDRRFLLRAELDAAFFHLYGIERDDVDYIMETFPIVRKNDEKAHGAYRTKRVILEIYDEMTQAIRTGKPYQTRLDTPPADPRVAHPPRTTTSRRPS